MKPRLAKVALVLLAVMALAGAGSMALASSHFGPPACTAPDCVIYDLSTQATCTEITLSPPTGNPRWHEGLSLAVDNELLGGDVVAFKIRWFTGHWSGWYVPGVNDIDIKFNRGDNTMRRMWSYFTDHFHAYILCEDS